MSFDRLLIALHRLDLAELDRIKAVLIQLIKKTGPTAELRGGRMKIQYARANTFAAIVLALITLSATAAPPEEADAYLLQPGDVLSVSVWKEDDLTLEVIVRPDGRISFPLVGEAMAAGTPIESVRDSIAKGLNKYIPDPVVTVSAKQLAGNKVYVIGKVNRPGEFTVLRNVDVMQALSMAGGTSTYAALNDIKILRRENGKLEAMSFEYGDVEKGDNLEQNIILKAGDVVVVP